MPRFSLRLMLGLMVLVCLTIGGWTVFSDKIRSQWIATAPLVEKGATVEAVSAGVPTWLLWAFPEGESGNIEVLRFNGSYISPESVEAINRLPKIQALDMRESRIHNQAIFRLDTQKVRNLRGITVRGVALNDDAIFHLAKLPTLELLDIRDSKGLTWRSVSAFHNREGFELRHNLTGRMCEVKAHELELLESLKLKPSGIIVSDPSDDDLTRPPISGVNDLTVEFVRPCQLTDNSFSGLLRSPNKHDLTFKFSNTAELNVIESLFQEFSNLLNRPQQQLSSSSEQPITSPISSLDLICVEDEYVFVKTSFEDRFENHVVQRSLAIQFPVSELDTKLLASIGNLGDCKSLTIYLNDRCKRAIQITDATPYLEKLLIHSWDMKYDEFVCGQITKLAELKHLELQGDISNPQTLPANFFHSMACNETLINFQSRGPAFDLKQLEPLAKFPNLKLLRLVGNNIPQELAPYKNQISSLKKVVAENN